MKKATPPKLGVGVLCELLSDTFSNNRLSLTTLIITGIIK
jgi:hypothetical protein